MAVPISPEVQQGPRTPRLDRTDAMPTSPSGTLGFDMATPQRGGAETRIIYTDDADLAVMLESLARGNDSAKFEIQRSGSLSRKQMLEEDAQRLRVEAESECASLPL